MIKYLNLNSESVKEQFEFVARHVTTLNEHQPNPKRCKKGHQYVNAQCINCGRFLIEQNRKQK